MSRFYATLDPNFKGTTVTLSNGNLTATQNTNAEGWGAVYSNLSKTSGKWYWELTFTTSGPIQFPDWQVGIAKSGLTLSSPPGSQAVGYIERTLNIAQNNSSDHSYGSSQPTQGDTIGILMDLDSGTIAITDASGTSNPLKLLS